MNRLRTLALTAAPTALLIGLAAPASIADANTQKAPAAAAAATCTAPAADQVLTAKEGIRLKKCITARAVRAPKTWHWMGNYASVYAVTAAANGGGIGAGELITEYLGGVYPTFMFY